MKEALEISTPAGETGRVRERAGACAVCFRRGRRERKLETTRRRGDDGAGALRGWTDCLWLRWLLGLCASISRDDSRRSRFYRAGKLPVLPKIQNSTLP